MRQERSPTFIWKKLTLASALGPGQKLVFAKGVEIKPEMLLRARNMDDDDLSARMDIEIYFTAEFKSGTKKKSLLFYLVRPIEYVFGSKLRVQPDKRKEKQLVQKLRKKLMGLPAHIKHTVTITISQTQTTADSQSVSIQGSTEKTRGSEVKLTVPFSELLEGLELEASFSSEVKEAIAYSYTTEHSFSSEEGGSYSDTFELSPVRGKGKYRQVIIEPKLKAVPIDKVYHYTQVNEFGMAGKVEALDIPFIYKIDGWHINVDEFGDE